MRLLFAGLGSIGQRHLRNVRQLLGDGAEILAFRERGLPHVITPAMTVERDGSVMDRYGVEQVDRLADGLAARPDAVFVCNPTSRHLDTARAALQAGGHVFVEKPLSHSADGIDAVIALAESRRRVAAVGYQLRFHPALRRVRECLAGGAVGPVISIRAEMSEHLPSAHPYEDYRQSYAARADLGGGVILCYSHEFDYLYWLFGMPARVSAAGGRLGGLDIDVEDTVSTTLHYAVEGRVVAAHLHLSFLPELPTRRLEIRGERGTLKLDFIAGTLRIETAAGSNCEHHAVDRNQPFLDELAAFLEAIGGRAAPIVSIREGAASLRIALAAKASMRTGQVVEL